MYFRKSIIEIKKKNIYIETSFLKQQQKTEATTTKQTKHKNKENSVYTVNTKHQTKYKNTSLGLSYKYLPNQKRKLIPITHVIPAQKPQDCIP